MSFFDEKVAPFLKEGTDVATMQSEFEIEVDTQTKGQVAGLIKNREEILNEKKALQKEYTDYKEKYASFDDGEITFEMFSQVRSENEALKASGGGGDLTRERETEIYERGKKAAEDALSPKIQKLESDNTTLNGSLDSANGKYLNFRARNEILKAVDEANLDMDDFWLEGLIGKAEINYNDQEDRLDIMVSHESGRIPLEDWKNVYPASEAGKKRLKAPVNTGGGASGGRGSTGGKQTLEQISQIQDRGDRLKAMEENGY